ncbi:MAG: hypothetical protein ACERK9_08230 [Deltaproteobacteria bacterium]|jgi:hypothetical protein
MSEKHRKIKKIEVGKVTREKTPEQKTLYIRIHFASKLARESVLTSQRIEFPCTGTTDFLDNFDTIAAPLNAEIAADTVLIVKELDEDELAIVAQAWQIMQPPR